MRKTLDWHIANIHKIQKELSIQNNKEMDDKLRNYKENKILVFESELQVPVYIMDYRHDPHLNTFDIDVVTCDGELKFSCYLDTLDFEENCSKYLVSQ